MKKTKFSDNHSAPVGPNNELSFPEALFLKVRDKWPLRDADHSDHSPEHWRRVYSNGINLAKERGIEDPEFLDAIMLFALFHDSQRISEFDDESHGMRGSFLLAEFGDREWITASLGSINLARTACELHTDHQPFSVSKILADPKWVEIMEICFDADRLDFVRLGQFPDTEYLFTEEAKEMVGKGSFWLPSGDHRLSYLWKEHDYSTQEPRVF